MDGNLQKIKGLTVTETHQLKLPGNTLSIPIFRDQDGVLWSESIHLFKEDTWKILIDPTGMIRGYTKIQDSFSLLEDEIFCSVIELSDEQIPPEFFQPQLFNMWAWNEELGIVKRGLEEEEEHQINIRKKNSLMEEISRKLQPLQLAEKYSDQTSEESELQVRLEKLLIKVGRIDPKGKDILWPDIN